jgi:hypothetical protein
MFKTQQNSGYFVGIARKACVGFAGLLAVVEFYLQLGVGKIAGFCQFFAMVLQQFSHNCSVAFISVLGDVIPAFHKTYNKLLLFKLLSY